MPGPALQLVNAGGGAVIPFGTVQQGQPLTFVLPLKNIGNAPLTISNISVNVTTGNASDFTLVGFAGSLTIAPAATDTSLSVTFTPTAVYETLEQATLTFTSNSVSGVSQFSMTGTVAQLGVSTVVSSTTSTETASATQASVGTNGPNYSSATSFASTAVSGGVTVNVNGKAAGSVTIGGSGSALVQVQVSTNSAVSWQTVYTFSLSNVAGTTPFSAPFTLNASGVTNLNQVSVRCVATATVSSSNPEGVSCTVTISAMTATIATSGDTWLQIVQVDGSGNVMAPVANFGQVAVGTLYTSNTFRITNPSPNPVSVTLLADVPSGYTVVSVSGANPVLPNSGSTLTFQLQLIPPSGGTQDDDSAVTITGSGLDSQQYIEALYTAPPLVSAYTLTGEQEATLVALTQEGGHASELFQFNAAQAAEDSMSFSRQYYVDQAQLNKMLNRIWLLYEHLGAQTLTVTTSTVNPQNTPSSTDTAPLSALTDGLLDVAVFDVTITGSVIQVAVSAPAGGNPFSIVGWIPKLDERGEVIENT